MPTLSELGDTMEVILQQAMAHVVAPERAATMTQDERLAALAPFEATMKVHLGMLRECLEQASAEGANSVHRALHAQPGVDPYMLDEAVQYAPTGDDDG